MRTSSFTDYMNRVIEDLRKEERYGTAYIYGYALKAFSLFEGNEELPFSTFSKVEMKQFELYLLNRGKSWNTISTYLRALRAVYNRAVDEEVIPGELRLFNGVFTGVMSDRKLALSAQEMQELVNEKAQPQAMKMDNYSEGVLKARHLLALMLLLQGIGFADLAHLRKENMKKNSKGQFILQLRRQKTGMELSIQVSPQAMQLIELYRSTDEASPYLLNLLDGTGKGEEAYRRYKCQLRKLNYNLARLATLCGIDSPVSSYTARHTWATLAKFCEVPEEIISEGLGHSSLEVTRTYLKRFEGDKLDKANRIITNYVMNGKKQLWGSL